MDMWISCNKLASSLEHNKNPDTGLSWIAMKILKNGKKPEKHWNTSKMRKFQWNGNNPIKTGGNPEKWWRYRDQKISSDLFDSFCYISSLGLECFCSVHSVCIIAVYHQRIANYECFRGVFLPNMLTKKSTVNLWN